MSHKAVYWALEQSGMKPAHWVVLIKLADRADTETNECWPSYNRLAKDVGMSRRTVIDSVAYLAKTGYLTVRPRKCEDGDRTSNIFKLNVGVSVTKVEKIQGGEISAPPGETVEQESSEDNQETTSLPSADSAPPSAGNSPRVVQNFHHGGAESAPKSCHLIIPSESLSLVPGNLEDTGPEHEPVAARERENNFSEKPNPPDQKTPGPVACIDDPPDHAVPELSPEGKFIAPHWLPIELWRQWLSVRPNPPLSAFGERTECKRLWAMAQQGWGLREVLEDAITRAKPRLSAPCKPGDEKRILAERNRDKPVKPEPVHTDHTKTLVDLRCELRTVSQDIKHLETLIGRAEGESKLSLLNQKKRAEGLVQEITTKIGRINLDRGVVP